MGWRRITTLPSNWALSASSKSWSEAAAIGGTESAQRVIKSNENLFIFRPFEQECTLAAAGDQSRKHRFFVFLQAPRFRLPIKERVRAKTCTVPCPAEKENMVAANGVSLFAFA